MQIEAVIFDYNRTLVQGEDTPPALFPETLPLLNALKARRIKMALVSVGEDQVLRRQEIDGLGLSPYFQAIRIVGKNDRKDLQPVLNELGVEGKACIVVGDRIKKEIVEGNKVGAYTVWIRQGKFAEEKPKSPEEEPTHTINSLLEVLPLINQETVA